MAKKKTAATKEPLSADGTRTLIAARMRHLGWNNTTLAKAASTSDANVSRYLAGADVRSSILMRLFDALGIGLIIVGEINEA